MARYFGDDPGDGDVAVVIDDEHAVGRGFEQASEGQQIERVRQSSACRASVPTWASCSLLCSPFGRPTCRHIIGDPVTDKILYMASAALATLSLFSFFAHQTCKN